MASEAMSTPRRWRKKSEFSAFRNIYKVQFVDTAYKRTFLMTIHTKATVLLISFIGVFVVIQGCKTQTVVHVHNGKPVEGSNQAKASGSEQVVSAAPAELLPVDITMILDRSGSMGPLTEQVITSYNDFIAEQKTVDGEAFVSLIQFDDKYEPNYTGVAIQNADELNTGLYMPRGSTALFDAIGRAITEAKDRIAPGSSDVVFVITTDGLENASTDYSGDAIKELIAECETQYGWHFMYLAASDEAFNQHEGMGIGYDNCLKLEATPEGWQSSQQLMSINLSIFRNVRTAAALEFKDEDRDVE